MKLSLRNPFNKQTDQARAADGKFTAGSGGLESQKKFNWKRAIPVIVITALVGGLFIFKSFAGPVAPPVYQYQVASCANSPYNGEASADVCKSKSAEALTYRLYLGALGREPDEKGYKFWVQRLAGDRAGGTRVAQQIMNTNEAKWPTLDNQQFVKRAYQVILNDTRTRVGLDNPWVKQLEDKKVSRDDVINFFAGLAKMPSETAQNKMLMLDNQAFVARLYTKVLNRQPTATTNALSDAVYVVPANDYWLRNLNDGKVTRDRALLSFAVSSEALTKSAAGFNAYYAKVPKVTVSQTAVTNQNRRASTVAQYVTSAKQYSKKADDAAKKANQLATTAKSKANGNQAKTRTNLDSIGDLQKQAEGYKRTAQSAAAKAKEYLTKAEKVATDAAAVAKFSPDIPDSTVKANRDKVLVYSTVAQNRTKDAGKSIESIASSYSVARGKYEAEQRRIAEEAARRQQQSGGGSSIPDIITPPGFPACPYAMKDINPERGKANKGCAAKLQKACGLTVDGIWGNNTQTCYNGLNNLGSGGGDDSGCSSQAEHQGRCSTNCTANENAQGRCGTGSGSSSSCPTNQTKRGNSCVAKYVYARSYNCWGNNKTKVHKPYGNRSKYRCEGGGTSAPSNMVCYNSDYYAPQSVGSYYYACIRK